jgi:hypothetical protein
MQSVLFRWNLSESIWVKYSKIVLYTKRILIKRSRLIMQMFWGIFVGFLNCALASKFTPSQYICLFWRSLFGKSDANGNYFTEISFLGVKTIICMLSTIDNRHSCNPTVIHRHKQKHNLPWQTVARWIALG